MNMVIWCPKKTIFVTSVFPSVALEAVGGVCGQALWFLFASSAQRLGSVCHLHVQLESEPRRHDTHKLQPLFNSPYECNVSLLVSD